MGRVSLLNVDEIRGDFPIFSRQVGGRPLIYLDSAATSQRPRQVVEAVRRYYEEYNSNVHRGVYSISVEATEEYERARRKISRFINAKSEREVVFVRGTTEALNLVAYAWALRKLRKGDKILLTEMEHHSNIVPWQLIAQHTGAEINYIPFNRYDGKLELDKLDRYKDFKILSFTYASNVLGTINDAKRLVKYAHENNALAVIDAAQAVPHMRVDVQEIGCDFLAFSGHKMLGPSGIGVLWGRLDLLEDLEPPLGGGGTVKRVRLGEGGFKIEWDDPPWKFEAGTPPIIEAVGLAEAVRYLEKAGMEEVARHERSLTEHMLAGLSELGDRVVIAGPRSPLRRQGIVSFALRGSDPDVVGLWLDSRGIAVRTGLHCAHTLHDRLGLPTGTVRASVYIYNCREDVEYLVEAIEGYLKVAR